MPRIRLADALDRYRREEDAYTNSYDWYRRDAQRSGSVTVGRVRIPAQKVSGAWCVDEKDVARALVAHRQRIAERKAVTADYERHVLRADSGDWIDTDWGRYQIRGAFHLVLYSHVPPWKGNERWICNSCWRPAGTEHDREECHRCSDWSPCGRDCTLSRVFCDDCHAALEV